MKNEIKKGRPAFNLDKKIDKFSAQEKNKTSTEISENAGNVEVKPQRDARGYFLPGNTIGTGTKNRYMKIIQAMSEEEFHEIFRVIITKSKAGDIQAIQLLLKYLIPTLHEPPVIKGLRTKSAKELCDSMDVVIDHMSDGDISTEDALNYIKALEQKRSFIQSADLEEKIKQIELRVNGIGAKR